MFCVDLLFTLSTMILQMTIDTNVIPIIKTSTLNIHVDFFFILDEVTNIHIYLFPSHYLVHLMSLSLHDNNFLMYQHSLFDINLNYPMQIVA